MNRREDGVVGLEMEGYGLLAAIAEFPARVRPGVSLIKAAVDWGSYGKSNKYQRSASEALAAFFREFLTTVPIVGDTTDKRGVFLGRLRRPSTAPDLAVSELRMDLLSGRIWARVENHGAKSADECMGAIELIGTEPTESRKRELLWARGQIAPRVGWGDAWGTPVPDFDNLASTAPTLQPQQFMFGVAQLVKIPHPLFPHLLNSIEIYRQQKVSGDCEIAVHLWCGTFNTVTRFRFPRELVEKFIRGGGGFIDIDRGVGDASSCEQFRLT